MKNLGKIMQQAQKLQDNMNRMQEELAAMEVTGTAGAGMVTVTMSGKSEAKTVKIDPKLLDGEEAEVVEDLIVAAINDARAKIESETQQRMSDLTGGLPLPPGMKLPF